MVGGDLRRLAKERAVQKIVFCYRGLNNLGAPEGR